MIAFVDESYGAERYLFAAAILNEVDETDTREFMWSLRLPGQRKLHWRNENNQRRELISDAVSLLPIEHFVVVRASRFSERTERQRRRCLEYLFFELSNQGLKSVIFESRSSMEDKGDRALLDAMRAKKHLDGDLRIEHAVGSSEPLLWVADAICGMAVSHLEGDGRFLQKYIVGKKISIHSVA